MLNFGNFQPIEESSLPTRIEWYLGPSVSQRDYDFRWGIDKINNWLKLKDYDKYFKHVTTLEWYVDRYVAVLEQRTEVIDQRMTKRVLLIVKDKWYHYDCPMELFLQVKSLHRVENFSKDQLLLIQQIKIKSLLRILDSLEDFHYDLMVQI